MPVAKITAVIEKHNTQMANVHTYIKPERPIDFPKGGMAFIYAFRWWLNPDLEKWLPGTVAWRGLQKADLGDAYIAHFQEFKFSPLGALLLAEYDASWRAGVSVTLLEQSQWYLPLSSYDGRFVATIEDVGALYASIDGVFRNEVFVGADLVCNPSFSGSSLVGGADANMIIGCTLFDIRTTLKRRPANLTNFYQQIMYYLLDLDNHYRISHLGWYYSRQRSYFVYPVDMFVPHPNRTRDALATFLTTSQSVPIPDVSFGIGP